MESISKVSTLLEAARELTLEASRDASASRRPLRPMPPEQIKKLLSSRSERDVLEGLRRVITMQYTSPLSATLPYFAAVLNTLSQPTSLTRPLVYAYLLHHAEAEPDTALLAINTIQKSLSDSNPRVRAMALRTMSGIKVPVISQIVSLAIKKGVADMSPLVRKTAAFACVKCVRLDPTTLPQVTDYIGQLLSDQQYYVASAAVAASNELCPERIDLIHKHYRSLVRKVVDMDEWGQLATIHLLTRYSRMCFPYRIKRVRRIAKPQAEQAKDFYDEEPKPADDDAEDGDTIEQQVLDPDLSLFLNATLPLLQSRTSALILQLTHTYLCLAPSQYLAHAIGPLVALLRTPSDIRIPALQNIVVLALSYPHLFVPYYRHFTLRISEDNAVTSLKMELLALIFPHSTTEQQALTLAELEHFSSSNDSAITKGAVRAIGRCSQTSSQAVSARCLRLLLKQVYAPDENLVAEALEVIRRLIQADPARHRKTVIRLARNLDTLKGEKARASVIWLVGEFAALEVGSEQGVGGLAQSVAPDVWRILVRGYVEEGERVRGQILLLGAKVYLLWLNERKSAGQSPVKQESDDGAFTNDGHGPTVTKKHPIELLWQHTLLLARYTPSYDIRDRARLFRALLSTPASTELASLLLLAPKPVPQAPSPSESRQRFELGSASLIVGEEAGMTGLKGYAALPEWVVEGQEPDTRLRDAGESKISAKDVIRPGATPAGRMLDDAIRADEARPKPALKEKTLEGWLNESEGEEETETEEETEYEEGTDEDEESEEEEEGEESDEGGDEQQGLVR